MRPSERLYEYRNVLTQNFCGKVYPLYVLIESLLKIQTKDGGKVVPFILNDAQVETYIEMCKQRLNGEPIRIDILKSRQLGMSTFISAVFFIKTLFTPNFKTCVIADTKEHASNIFAKYNFFYYHLDDNNPNRERIKELEKEGNKGAIRDLTYKPAIKWARGQTYLETTYNSILEVLVAGESAGRSSTYQMVHFSEVAFFDNLTSTITALLSTVSIKNLNSMIFFETTANGYNEYKEIWDEDFAGRTAFKPLFFPWFKDNNATLEDRGEELPTWLKEKQKEYGLSETQMAWYLEQFKLMRNKKSECLQEFPFCPTDCFISTGNFVFNNELVRARKQEIASSPRPKVGNFIYEAKYSSDGRSIEIVKSDFMLCRDGAVRIYKEPEEGVPYILICDPNNSGLDDTAMQVIDNRNSEQVAVFKSNTYSLTDVSFYLYLLAKKYNYAFVSVEMNTNPPIIENLLKLSYPIRQIYVRQEIGASNYLEPFKKTLGHKISPANRDYLIDTFVEIFTSNPRVINDYDTICELETFQNVAKYDKSGKIAGVKREAAGNNHDDLVMSLIPLSMVRKQYTLPYSYGHYFANEISKNGDDKNDYFSWKKSSVKKKSISAITRFTGIKW